MKGLDEMQRQKGKCRSKREVPVNDPDEISGKDLVSEFRNRSASSRDDAVERAIVSRRQRVQRIKDEIERGVYESEEKLTIAIDRLIDDVLRHHKG